MKLKRRNFFLEIIIGLVLIYASVLVLLFIFQRNLMYHPNENNYFGDKLEVNIEKVNINTPDNLSLLGWFHKKDLNKFKTIIYFHGNAGNLLNRVHKLNELNKLDVNILLISWRSFSGNKGKPSEKNLYHDGNKAVEWLNEQGINKNDIIKHFASKYSISNNFITPQFHMTQNHKLSHQDLTINYWILSLDYDLNHAIEIKKINDYPFPKPLHSFISTLDRFLK